MFKITCYFQVQALREDDKQLQKTPVNKIHCKYIKMKIQIHKNENQNDGGNSSF